jgi:hypothetical protein
MRAPLRPTVLALLAYGALASAAGCGGSTTRLVAVPDIGVKVPVRLVDFANDRWPGAHIAAAAGTCAPAGAPVVTGDFNSDGTADTAARVVGRDGAPHLVMAFGRVRDYDVREMASGPTAPVDGALSVGKRGTKYHVESSELDFYFGADTLVVTPCGGRPTAYIWNGSTFDPTALAS